MGQKAEWASRMCVPFKCDEKTVFAAVFAYSIKKTSIWTVGWSDRISASYVLSHGEWQYGTGNENAREWQLVFSPIELGNRMIDLKKCKWNNLKIMKTIEPKAKYFWSDAFAFVGNSINCKIETMHSRKTALNLSPTNNKFYLTRWNSGFHHKGQLKSMSNQLN